MGMTMGKNHFGGKMRDRELNKLPEPEDVKRQVADFLDDLDEGGDGSFDREPRRPIPPSSQTSRRLTRKPKSNIESAFGDASKLLQREKSSELLAWRNERARIKREKISSEKDWDEVD